MATKVLCNMGEMIKAKAMMYKAVLQAVLLYGSKIWVVKDEMIMALEEFHHRIARQIAGMTQKKGDGG